MRNLFNFSDDYLLLFVCVVYNWMGMILDEHCFLRKELEENEEDEVEDDDEDEDEEVIKLAYTSMKTKRRTRTRINACLLH
jgi:hypothetical protein